MRNPHRSLVRTPGSQERGEIVRSFLLKAQKVWPELCLPAMSILRGQKPGELPEKVVDKLRETLLHTLWQVPPRAPRTARANTPLHSSVLAGWAEDPDSLTLADWLDHGAPMGFLDPVKTTGIFPTVPAARAELETNQIQAKTLAEWRNYSSAETEASELRKLIEEYETRGFCHLADSVGEVQAELGRPPILNRLGLIIKDKINDQGEVVRKSRVIWDLRRSGANSMCHQGERILLPRLLDLAADILWQIRQGKQAWIAAVDIRDAFMNIPVAGDRFALTSAIPAKKEGDPMQVVVFDTLVFGAASSPTVWGRYAAWLGRTIAAITPNSGCQVYVDDPAFSFAGTIEEAATELTLILLWMAITGFPVKLSKAGGGKAMDWIGATIEVDDMEAAVVITIPVDKVKRLLDTTTKFLGRPVVGSRELRAYAGALSFVAGLIPHLRPFLSSIWAALPFDHATTDDGARPKGRSGRLVHVKRIKPALQWILALLKGNAAPLARRLEAFTPSLDVTVTTDACPFGLGGTLRVDGKLVAAFGSDIPSEALQKFKAERGDAKHTTLWEALSLLFACRAWLPQFKGTARIRCKSDSLSLLLMLLRGRAKSPDLSVIAREFSMDLARDRYRLHLLKHIPGVTNIEADALSRLYAPFSPEVPQSLCGVPRTPVDITAKFWTVSA